MENVLMTLHQFLLSWLTDESFREENPELKQAMEEHGLADVTGEDVHQAMMLVSDELPPYQAQQMSPYLNAPSGAYNTGSSFNITQGGSAGAAGTGAQAASGFGINESYGGGTGGGTADQYILPTHHGDTPLDDAVREVQFITNNFTTITETNTTNIDDRDTAVDNSVRQVIDTDGGNLNQEFDQDVVSGDGNAFGDGSAVQGGDGNVAGTGNQAGDGSAFGDGSAVQGGEGNVAGTGNLGITGDGVAFGTGNVTGDVSGEGNSVGFDNQASSGTGNTTAFEDGDATSTGNIVGGDDVNAVGNIANTGDDADIFVEDSQFAGDDITNIDTEVDVDVANDPAAFQA
jgi:hypothetical protein